MALTDTFADVTQLVECLTSTQAVAGSSPVIRSFCQVQKKNCMRNNRVSRLGELHAYPGTIPYSVNGNTSDSGPLILGSSPGRVAWKSANIKRRSTYCIKTYYMLCALIQLVKRFWGEYQLPAILASNAP